MVARNQVVLIQTSQSYGTGFLIGRTRMLTALHVVAEAQGTSVTPFANITCIYYSELHGFWEEDVEFNPHDDPHDSREDWLVLTVRDTRDTHVWRCRAARSFDRGQACWSYGFSATLGEEGVALTGTLTGLCGRCQQK